MLSAVSPKLKACLLLRSTLTCKQSESHKFLFFFFFFWWTYTYPIFQCTIEYRWLVMLKMCCRCSWISSFKLCSTPLRALWKSTFHCCQHTFFFSTKTDTFDVFLCQCYSFIIVLQCFCSVCATRVCIFASFSYSRLLRMEIANFSFCALNTHLHADFLAGDVHRHPPSDSSFCRFSVSWPLPSLHCPRNNLVTQVYCIYFRSCELYLMK